MQVVTYNALVGFEIEQVRKTLNLDQSELAKRTGISQPVLSRLEKGKASITIDQLFSLCAAMQKSPHDVIEKVHRSVEAIKREQSVQLTTNKEIGPGAGAFLSGAALGAVLGILLSRK